jgi:hypothetical protein
MIRVGLLPDEHVYSALVRDRMLSGQMYISDQRFFQLNDIAYHQIQSQLPLDNQLLKIIDRMGLSHAKTLHVRLNHTPAAVWMFNSPERLVGVESEYLNTSRTPLQYLSFDTRWRYCPTCAMAERTSHGFSYWHSNHQQIGAKICEIHQQVLHSHDELDVLSCSLPHHWLETGKPLELKPIEVEWQSFINTVSSTIKNDLNWPERVKLEIKQLIKSKAPKKLHEKKLLISLMLQMQADLTHEFIDGFIRPQYRNVGTRRKNILRMVIVAHNTKQVKSPVLWLIIVFWLRNELSECQHLR